MSTEPLTAEVKPPALFSDDSTLRRLAREVAMDIQPIDKILALLELTYEQWEFIRQSSAFQRYLKQEVEAWDGALNTAERVRLKSLAFIEESLPEFYARVHDRREALSAKTEVLKAVSKLAGLGQTESLANGADRFSVTINLGGKTLNITKDITPVGNPQSEPPLLDFSAVNAELG